MEQSLTRRQGVTLLSAVASYFGISRSLFSLFCHFQLSFMLIQYLLSLLVLVSPLCIIQSEFVPFSFLFFRQFVYFCYYRSSVSFVMFHPVIVTVCISVIYLVSHIYPSSSLLTLHHLCLNHIFLPFSFFSQGISSPTLNPSQLTFVSICVL